MCILQVTVCRISAGIEVNKNENVMQRLVPLEL